MGIIGLKTRSPDRAFSALYIHLSPITFKDNFLNLSPLLMKRPAGISFDTNKENASLGCFPCKLVSVTRSQGFTSSALTI